MAAESPSRSDMLTLGAVVAVALLAGMGLGWLIDSVAGTAPAFLLVGLLLGLVGAIWYVVLQFRRYLKSS